MHRVEVGVIHVVVEQIEVDPTGPRDGGLQISFCKLGVNKESDDGIESIYQIKIDSSLNSDIKVKEGVCYFLKSRLPTVQGTVNGRKVEVLQDTGCTC